MGAKAVSVRPLEQIRDGTRDSRDPRALRTRAAILGAVSSLLAENTSGALTVTDILERAQVGKTSFYSHFASLEHLALDIFTETFGRPDRAGGVSVRPFSVEGLVDHYLSHARLYRSILGAPFSHDISMSTVEVVAAALARTRGRGASGSPGRAVSDVFWASALIGTLDAWLRGVLTGSREQIIASLSALTPAEFSTAAGTSS
jgi:AcrR family transcriptional regulator